MLLFTLLHNKILKPERGDVVVFNNTSAEHPATYDFVKKCQRIAEDQYGMPFFWTEFQTFEDASAGEWARLPSYRLVLPKEHSPKNPNGYHCGGEVFEEVLSWRRHLPLLFQRICTVQMKIAVTREFLADWFAAKTNTERLGHYYDREMLRDDTVIKMHNKNRGKTPDDVLLEKAAFMRARPAVRPAQRFAEYSKPAKPFANKTLAGKAPGGKVALSGDNCADYVSFVGFRADEPARVARMQARNYDRGADNNDPHIAAPEGEYVYAPLAGIGIGRDDVKAFWQGQQWDLQLPHDVNLSNCAYCFLKGSKTLASLVANRESVEKQLPKALRAKPNTPADIHWWVTIEKKYGRDLVRENRKILNPKTAGKNPFIGFWGINARLSYEMLANAKTPAALTKIAQEESALPCDCTD